ncbi:DHA2 family efflux MFS transporter permease subunit [Actinoplanes sp. NPDC049316]|uniref:DHA2 family efflux MFS transporter permease subunit n=1 Tax=Actinoplanes sp. NPDC049316 TaxID=3154727 RepID=UPI00341E70BE
MPELTPRRRLLVLAICCLSLFIVGLDSTIVNIALPSLRADLGASVSGLQWVIDAYTLVLASLLVLAGSTADRVGRRRTFQTGLALFTAGSLLCSIAPDLGWLVAFRTVQAVGGSMLNPVAMSIITNTFTEPRERARAIGVWGGVVGLSMALGPVLGGALVAGLGWRSIFWINVPVGVAAIVLAAVFVPESRAARPRRLDPIGQLLVLTVLATVVFGIIEGPSAGWTDPVIIGCFVAGAAALATLIRYETRRHEPLLDLRVFRSVPFSGAAVIAVCAFGTLGGFLFLNSLYLQEVRGLSALQAGLYTLPMALVTAVVAPLSGRIVGAHGPRLPLILAGAAIAVAMLPLTRLNAGTPVWLLAACYAVFGFGFGMVNAPITNTAVSGLPRAQAGVAAAIASTSRQVGAALGVAVIGAVVVSGLGGTAAARLAEASRSGWWIMVACGLVVLLLGVLTTGRRARATAERAGADLLEVVPA